MWIKTRNETENHFIVDSVRGVTKQLYANSTGQEYTNANRFKAFNPNGFTVGTTDDTNQNGNSFVAWAWKAGGRAVSNTDGSITSQVSASDEYGFSICTYTGTGSNGSFGHGLNSVPKFIIVKSRSDAQNWAVQHASEGATKYSFLQSTNGFSTTGASAFWNDTAPTNSVVNVGTDNDTNGNTKTYVAYCWSEVSGYSKFGSYSGSSSSDVTITTGFKPRFILIKCSDTAGQEWVIKDNVRGGDKYLHANDNSAEATGRDVTFNSDGFTLAHTQGPTNFNGRTYVYAAFGDRPGNNFTPNNLIATAGLETASQGMDVVTYSGSNAAQNITSLNFQPDFIWFKARSYGGSHALVDSIRGISNFKVIRLTLKALIPQLLDLSLLTVMDLALGTESSATGSTNGSGQTYVAWCWKAGGTASSNTDGTITSSVSANQTYGFSICNYVGNATSGASFGHGLGAAPKWVIIKSRDSGHDWIVYHASVGDTGALRLNNNSAVDTNIKWFNNTSPSSSVFTLGNTGGTNDNGDNMLAYCWSEIPGFSKFSSYIGSGSSGNKVTTGFKPRFIIAKRKTNISGSHMGWTI